MEGQRNMMARGRWPWLHRCDFRLHVEGKRYDNWNKHQALFGQCLVSSSGRISLLFLISVFQPSRATVSLWTSTLPSAQRELPCVSYHHEQKLLWGQEEHTLLLFFNQATSSDPSSQVRRLLTPVLVSLPYPAHLAMETPNLCLILYQGRKPIKQI